MSDSSQISTDSEFSIIKLKNALEELSSRSENTSDANSLLSEATALFRNFFENIADPEFTPLEFKKGDTPRSKDYNDNLQKIYNDISRFYIELINLTNVNIKSFNFSQVVIAEINKRARGVASIVLDLNILSNFTRGDIIVAGDDFMNLEKVDTSAGLGSSQAEIVSSGAGLSLARAESNNLSLDNKTTIEVFPIAPAISNAQGVEAVNVEPTIGNVRRFYEGNYYNFLGAARPEGGYFNIQFILDPENLNPILIDGATPEEPGPENEEGEATSVPGPPPNDDVGMFLEYGASEESKKRARRAMLDNNPTTFWECEYNIRLQDPLIPDIHSEVVTVEENVEPDGENPFTDPESPTAAAIQIDIAELNTTALSKDTVDLVLDIVVTLAEDQNINFMSINPLVFSKKAFIEVIDISTISSSEIEFKTVDNWDNIRFPKTITPEANEFLSDSQLSASLAPNRFNYLGQGIYPFPTRIANKIKIRLAMNEPAAQLYEKTYALLKNNVDITTTTTTKKKKGFLASDRRLKKNISLIGNSPSGLNIYSFEYKNAKYGEGLFQGVMSDEIPQDAVIEVNGYDAVNYDMLDVEFKQIMSIKLNQGANA